MPHNISLITTIAAALGLAMVMGFVVSRLKMPPLVGYLIAGIIIGALEIAEHGAWMAALRVG